MDRKQSGFLLIEALIAILIFAFAILALVALQAVVIKETAEAKYRMEAALHTDRLLGQMWASNKVALPVDFASPGGGRFAAWRNELGNSGLPGVAANPPTVVFGANNQVTVSVFWQQPGAPAGTPPHQYVTITQIWDQ
jgi:type IV pilus assembly protein PilV